MSSAPTPTPTASSPPFPSTSAFTPVNVPLPPTRPRCHTWTPTQLDDLCVLRIHARLTYSNIGVAMQPSLGVLRKEAKVVSHKVKALDGTQYPSERLRKKGAEELKGVRDPLWIHWSSLTVRSLDVQTILRRYKILNPPLWPTQTRDDYLVVLVLYGNLCDDDIADQMNQSFRGEGEANYTAEKVCRKFEELEWLVEGSWSWWMTAGAGDVDVQDILRKCGTGDEVDTEGDGEESVEEDVQDDAENNVQEDEEDDVQEDMEDDAEDDW